MAFKIKEIQEKKALLRIQREELKNEILTTIFNPQAILTAILTSVANKYINPKQKVISSNTNSFLYKNVISKDDSGILSSAYSFIKQPVISAFLIRTRKSWIHWQLFNIGIFLIKKGYDYYKSKQYTEVEIIEEVKIKAPSKRR